MTDIIEEIEVEQEAPEPRSAEQIDQDYSAMGDSVSLIDAIIAGDSMEDEGAEERQDCVDRNTQHLELMLAKEDWSGQDFSATIASISAGGAYTAQ